MSKRTKFQDNWLSKIDYNKNIVSEWAAKVPKDPYSCRCNICNCTFLSEKGFEKLDQHAKTLKHKGNLFKIKQNQLRLAVTVTEPTTQLITNQSTNSQKSSEESRTSSQQVQNIASISLFSTHEAATRAELFFCMEIVNSNSSVSSCEGKKELFQIMFPGCVPDSFSLSPTKASYMITYALGPYFKNLLLAELQAPNVYFTLQYDETSNVKSKKELQIRVQYWSNIQNIVVNRHLVTYFIEKANAVTLFKYLFKALDSHNLSLRRVLALGSDGPNVNKKVFRLFQEKLKDLNYKCLFDIGTCSLHSAHNAFLKAMQCLDLDISDFIIKVFYFFHNQHLRCENFEKIQTDLKLPKHTFIKHISTRWLTIGPAAERVIEQLPALNEYFLKYIPRKENATMKKQSYFDIIKYLKNKSLRPTLEFTIYSSKIFTSEYTRKMQNDEPLIHILYSQLRKLIYILCSNIVKPSVLTDNENFLHMKSEKLLEKSNIRDLKDISFGEKVKDSISLLPESDKMLFLNTVKNFYIAAIKYMFEKIVNLKTLKNFECLLPENIKSVDSVNSIVKIANLLPLTDIDVDVLSHEWKLLQIDSEVSFVLKKNERIDEYWNAIFSLKSQSNLQYPVTAHVVKAALSLTHGSADVERGFSQSGRILTEDKARMNEKTLNARFSIIDGLKRFNSMPHKVPISGELLKLARTARHSYHMHLDEQKKIAEEKKKQEADEKERKNKEKAVLENVKKQIENMKKLELQLISEEEAYKETIKESESMQTVLKNTANSMTSKVVFQELILSLENLRNKEKDQRIKVEKLREKVQKRKSELIETTVNKRHKVTENHVE